MLQKKLALLLTKKNKKEFWSEVRRLNQSTCSYTPVVDGVSGDENIANLFATKSEGLLNTHTSSSHSSTPQSSLTGLCISEVSFSVDDVLQALFKLRQNKSDGSGVFKEHLKYASSVISEPLAALFTLVVRHGYMPLYIRDSVLTPIPKGNKTHVAKIIVLLLLPPSSARPWNILYSPDMSLSSTPVVCNLDLNLGCRQVCVLVH